MKSKDLKLMRKKLEKANKAEYNNGNDSSIQCHFQNVSTVTNNEEGGEKLVPPPPPPQQQQQQSEASCNNSNDDDKYTHTHTHTHILSIEYCRSTNLSEHVFQQCVDLFEENMKDLYQNSSWGFDLNEKKMELKHKNARFILVLSKDSNNTTTNNNSNKASAATTSTQKVAAYVHYRFDYDDDDQPSQAVLYLYEIQVNKVYQKHGIGQKLMQIVENIAKQAEMPKVMLTVFKKNTAAFHFYTKKLNYAIDENSPSKFNDPSADYEILSHLIQK